jgi:hypothetical protein
VVSQPDFFFYTRRRTTIGYFISLPVLNIQRSFFDFFLRAIPSCTSVDADRLSEVVVPIVSDIVLFPERVSDVLSALDQRHGARRHLLADVLRPIFGSVLERGAAGVSEVDWFHAGSATGVRVLDVVALVRRQTLEWRRVGCVLLLDSLLASLGRPAPELRGVVRRAVELAGYLAAVLWLHRGLSLERLLRVVGSGGRIEMHLALRSLVGLPFLQVDPFGWPLDEVNLLCRVALERRRRPERRRVRLAAALLAGFLRGVVLAVVGQVVQSGIVRLPDSLLADLLGRQRVLDVRLAIVGGVLERLVGDPGSLVRLHALANAARVFDVVSGIV